MKAHCEQAQLESRTKIETSSRSYPAGDSGQPRKLLILLVTACHRLAREIARQIQFRSWKKSLNFSHLVTGAQGRNRGFYITE